MLDIDDRIAILRLARGKYGTRRIAQALKVSRNTVRNVIKSGEANVNGLARSELATEHIVLIRELWGRCEGNLVRVHEELLDAKIELAYSTLTAFCRRQGIGRSPQVPAGQYHFVPGQEMQHDTSPHRVRIGGVMVNVECASLVLCYSRMLYAQVFLHWTRLEARIFLSEAIQAFQGSAARCMLDNSSVIIAHGTGKNAVPAAEMDALSARFGFVFRAHELGDANRSARVERPFHHIEHNFYVGRTFESLEDLNEQLKAWCQKVNRRRKRTIQAAPIELYAVEQPALSTLPIHVPEVYALHTRRVDVEGFVNVHRNRYSAPAAYLGRRLEVREGKTSIRFFDGPRLVAEHVRLPKGAGKRITLAEHRVDRRHAAKSCERGPTPEEKVLAAADPIFQTFVDALRKKHGGRGIRKTRTLHRMYLEYPLAALLPALTQALEYDLLDLRRIERMVLRNVAGDFFRMPNAGAPTAPKEHQPHELDEEDGGDKEDGGDDEL
ncbi:MAG: helix-turn-helix domain-containing protein [Anaerosomatales bacterium]|nr:helix-turn-helix domain-containing protein [Anaerosomatales bacterium]